MKSFICRIKIKARKCNITMQEMLAGKHGRRGTAVVEYLPPKEALERVVTAVNTSETDTPAFVSDERNPKGGLNLTLYGGIALTLLGSFQMSINSVIVKYIDNMAASELSLFRFLILFVVNMPYLVHSGQRVAGVPGQRVSLFVRGALGGFSLYLSYCATKMMPIAEASVVISTTPIFVTLLARIFLKESCDFIHVLSMILTILGLCLLVRLPLVIATGASAKFADSRYWLGFALALVSAFTGACAIVFVRRLSKVHVSVIIFNFSWVAIVEMAIVNLVLPSSEFVLPRCGVESALVLILGFFSFGGQLCFTFALRFEEAGTVSVVRFASRVILIFLWQTFFFRHTPDAYSIAAAVLVTLSVTLSTFRKYLKDKLTSKRKEF